MATDMTWQVSFHSQHKVQGLWHDMWEHTEEIVARSYAAQMQKSFPDQEYRAIKRTITEEIL